ncbi:uncharacterized protein H6S33_008544 [Morchella sextelata]|uniref:uncharacterized protein n=1 Tax=Morchella sextelata TaxID=1174677 RepID=UPI001D04B7A6|nr:uncharacterized protein H6S33_008544 [Morchella sextelata]KAH0602894.1 hypothetical protein H6S33_008544 [Morchella sextelata]
MRRVIRQARSLASVAGQAKLNRALVTVAERGDREAVGLYLQEGADIEARYWPQLGEFNNGSVVVKVERGIYRCVTRTSNVCNLGKYMCWGSQVHGTDPHDLSRTALQPAADGGHTRVVELLLEAGADVNAPPARIFGRTALQSAVEGRHEMTVQLLLSEGVDPNGPVPSYERTALQAAVEEGHKTILQLFVYKGADLGGALREAVEGQNEDSLQLLLDVGANINIKYPDGDTLLHIAVKCRFERIVELLLFSAYNQLQPNTDASHATGLGNYLRLGPTLKPIDLIAAIDHQQGNILHATCSDYNETIFLRHESLPAVQLLVSRDIDIDTRDLGDQTPLQIAVDKGLVDITRLLLKKGATTDRLTVKHLPILIHAYDGSNPSTGHVVLCRTPGKGTSVESVSEPDSIVSLRRRFLDTRSYSIHFVALRVKRELNSDSQSSRGEVSFVDPRSLFNHKLVLRHYTCDYSRITSVFWLWSTVDDHGSLSNHQPQFSAIPNKDVLAYSGERVIFIGYAYFCCPIRCKNHVSQSFTSGVKAVEIPWIMLAADTASRTQVCSLRTVQFRGTLNMRNISIPRHAAEFVTWFFQDISERWRVIIESAMLHITEIRQVQLSQGGRNPFVIQSLLKDSQEWSKLRKNHKENHLKMIELLEAFKGNYALYSELLPTPDSSDVCLGLDTEVPKSCHSPVVEPRTQDIEALPPIRRLSEQIMEFDEIYKAALSELDRESKEMIELEFNLITFIFLPLMFITSFFGMNVDILAKDPSWHLYFFVSIPFLAIVIAVWVLCKYLPLSEFFERGVGNYLSWAFGEGERRPKPLAFESQVVDITPGYKC